MLDDPNRQLLEEGWQAYQDERWDDLRNLLHDQIEWHEFHDKVTTGDHIGKDAVMTHFEECKTTYGVPSGRTYNLLQGDHALVTDQIDGDLHPCRDLYRIEDNLIREMWTCVTHPTEEANGESVTA